MEDLSSVINIPLVNLWIMDIVLYGKLMDVVHSRICSQRDMLTTKFAVQRNLFSTVLW